MRSLHSLRSGACWIWLLLTCMLMSALWPGSASAAIVFRGSSSGSNTNLPTNGTPGALTINRPAAARPGMVMIVSIAARPGRMTWTDPAGWTQLSIASEQTGGGVSTLPGGMTLRTYYRIVGLNEPTSYAWTFTNTTLGYGGTAVGGMLVFSGIDTASNPINASRSVLSPSSTIFTTSPVTTTVDDTMMVSVLSVLSATTFSNPTLTACGTSGPSAITRVLDVAAPAPQNQQGTTVNMAYWTQANAGLSCGTRGVIFSNTYADTGVAHLMALRPSERDLSLEITRAAPLSPGGGASYTLTATNEGTKEEPGPLAIVNTLPTGLTYTGFSGAGWSCSRAGQVITCSRTGAIAAGTSAPALTINASVAAGLSGVITNTATVSGTGGDGNSDNDTASETYVILPQPYAYYALDEASGAGPFANTTAITSVAATAIGTARTVGNPPSIGAALAGSPGTCGALTNPAGAGISTGIDPNNIGANTGSIAFWYAGTAAWNDGNARILLDASKNVGNDSQDRHFVLFKDASGRLVFSVRGAGGLTSTASSVSYTFAANTWHHIVVTWDLPNSRLNIYLDGNSVPVASSTTNIAGVLGDLNTLYIGAQRATGVGGVPAGYTANSANGLIDEVRIYNRALVALEAEGIADLTHACAGTVDHYELIVPSTASACTPLPAIQVYACAGPAGTASCSSNLQAAVLGKSIGLATSGGTLGTTTPLFDAIGQANTTLDYPTGGSATITLSGGTAPGALNPARCCPNGTSCVTANVCTTVITPCSVPANSFAVVDSYYADKSYNSAPNHQIYTKLAGWDESAGAVNPSNTRFRLDVVALRTDLSTETSFVGGTASKSVSMEILDDSGGAPCNASGSACAACAKPVVGPATPVTFTAGDAGYRNDVLVTMGGTGVVNTRAYPRLIARITDASRTPSVVACSADAFAVRPSTVLLATDASASGTPLNTATPVIAAGAPFKLHAFTTFGANFSAPLALDPAALRAQDPTSAAFDDDATAGILSPASLPANPASTPAGNATYSEVGYLYLRPGAYRDTVYTAVDQNATDDCIPASTSTVKTGGRYGCWIGTEGTMSLGRFIPHHLTTTLTRPNGSFTYSGQPFTGVTVSAMNANEAVTLHYRGLYAANATLSDANAGTNNSNTLGALTINGAAPVVSAAKFTMGVATYAASDSVAYTFLSRQTPPLGAPGTTPQLQLRATSAADGVSSSGHESLAVSPILSGRVMMSNAYGSAAMPLTVPVAAQVYTSNGWVTNTADSSTRLLAAPAVTAAGGISATARCPTIACAADAAFTGGLLDLRLSASTAGYADVALQVPSWLDYPWRTSTADDPRARATFGIYQGKNRVIYRRERY